ncbi:MAG: amino acid adenylation domain-containing protein [Myxococcota bacterium]
MPRPPARLDALLDAAATRYPAHGITFVGGGTLAWPAVREAACRAAGGAWEAGVRPGAPVLLLVADPEAFVPLFWGLVRLGAIVVPLAPPRDGSEAERGRIARVHAQLGGPVVSDLPVPGALDAAMLLAGPSREARGDAEVALLQFSSGSTRDPKGVVLTHANLLANVAQLAGRLPVGPDDVDLAWMPLFHDMGLIGCHLYPLSLGMRQVRMRADVAMGDPLVWLRAVATFGATTTATTNTALVRANRRLIATGERPDLTTLRFLFNGAEPIDPAVCRAFSRLTGLPEAAHAPMYGLAEAAVGVSATVDGLRTLPVGGRDRVDLGAPLPGVALRIVDARDEELPDGVAGAVQVAGPNVAAGYWRDDDATAALRCGEWIRTGDVGALVDGRLVLVGRDKDQLIVNGRNVPAHDVEALAEVVPGVRGAVATSDARAAGERVCVAVVLAEGAEPWRVLADVRRVVATGLGAEDVVAVPIDRIERTTSGKKRRVLVRASLEAGALDGAAPETVATVRRLWEEALRRPLADDALDATFRELGGGSLAAVDLLARVDARFGRAPDHRSLLVADGVRRMAAWLERSDPQGIVASAPPHADTAIAIIASACRLPGADAPADLAALVAGPTRIAPGSHGAREAGSHGSHGAGSQAGGWLADVATFDAARFGISADEAAAMDPQQRLFLTVAAEALERAGGAGAREGAGAQDRVGVYVGAGQQAYLETVLDALAEPDEQLPPGTLAGNLLSMLAGRVAHHLDLRGPALTVDTACSASLVAVHLACQALRAGECERAVAGGVNLNLGPALPRLFARAGALSPTGRCRPFAADADGTVLGEGAAAVVLKPLARARADGDRILGILRGSAVNNDGASLGVMAPNPAGQEAVIRAALAVARVDARDVTFVEAHATGTAVGDAVERGVLARCYPHGPPIGAVKGTIGHLLGAAGIAGLLRVVDTLGGGAIPGALGAVSSFGFGGTNAHVIVEGGPDREDRPVAAGAPRRHWLGDADATGWVHVVTRDVAGGLAWAPVTAPETPVHALRTGGRYLVTGASGGLGGALARWLARRWGARLVLLGRRPEADRLVGDVRRAGGDAVYLAGNLATEAPRLYEQALAAIVGGTTREADQGFDGVFHLAGGLDDAALAAKVAGAEAIGGARLFGAAKGFVVLFSSVSAVIPGLSAGIEGYAAANAALDRLARTQATHDGAGWMSVAWPPWAGVGLAAGHAAAFRARGIAPLAPARAFAALELALAAGAPNVVVLERPPTAGGALPADLRARVRALVAAAAGLAPDEVGDHDRVARLGVDSIAAVELVKALEGAVGRALPSTLVYEHDTVDAIVLALAGGAERRGGEGTGGAEEGERQGELLPSQQTFLVQRAFFPDVPGNVLLACTVHPPVARAVLVDALAVVAARHTSLATVFARGPRGWAEAPGLAPVVEWSMPELATIHARTFDLERGPLVRVYSDGARIVLDAHHSVVDAWSLQVVLRELLEVADGIERGTGAVPTPLGATWADAAAALRAVGSASGAASERYRDGVPPLPLPWEPASPGSGSGARAPSGPAFVREVLSEADTAGLVSAARAADVSLPALVLASYVERLWRWSGQHDVVVRVAQGRREVRVPDVTRIVGPFADSLPARVEVRPGEPLAALARRVARELATVGSQAGASALGVAALGSRGADDGPVGLTPAGFSFPLLPSPSRIGDRSIAEIHGASASGFTRLGLVAWVFDGRLHLSWNFLTSHLSPARVRGWAEEHVAALAAVARGSTGDAPSDQLHVRILAVAERVGDRVAVDGAEVVTYRTLARRSAALASHIVRFIGEPTEVPADLLDPTTAPPRIAVLASPSGDAIVAVLATLRAGAAWVGLDPSWPDARVAQVLAIAAPAVILAPPALLERARTFGVPVLAVGDEEAAEGPVRRGALAHVMFTSGSSGRPKGVAVGHAAVLAFLDWVGVVLGVTAEDRFVQTSSLSFGGCIRQMFAPLLAGGTVVPAPPHAMRDPAALLALLEAQRVTVFNAVPSVWMHLLDAAEQREADNRGAGAALPSVRWVLIGGEAVTAAYTRRWRAFFGDRHRLANLYGSTETIVNATWHEVVGEPAADEPLTPIGWPRAGLEVRLCEPGGMGLVGPGEVGEVVVSGAIAHGYLADPEQTARAFVALPGVGRAYRTGDLARRRADGAYVYVGRTDSQVQVRGNRVELGEIEAVLTGYPGVAHAAVVAPEGRIHARIEARPGVEVDGAAVRAWLAERLPVWMVPARVEVGGLVRSPAGKIDRRAIEASASAVAPSAPLLSTVAEAWRAVLRLPAAPLPDDDFFALGGDSVDVLDVVAHLREGGVVPPSPLAFYRARRLADVAALCAIEGAVVGAPVVVTPTVHTPADRWPLSPVQRGFWLAHQAGAPPVWTARVPLLGPLDADAFCLAVAALVERHPLLRIVEVDGSTQRVLPTRALAIPWEDLSALPEAARARALDARWDEARAARWDLATGPFLRLRVARLGPDRHALFLAAHHLVADAWSAWSMAGELLSLHDDFAAGRPARLPAVAATFDTEARRALAVRPDAWWDERLAGLAQAPAAAADLPARRVEVRVALDAPSWARLRRHARRHAHTPFVVVLAAFAEALAEVAPSPDLLVSVALAGREDPAMAGVVGPFATGLPLRFGARVDEAHVAATLDAALAHPSLVGVGAGMLARLGRYFLTWLDPAQMPGSATAVRADWANARTTFDAAGSGTEVLAAGLVGASDRDARGENDPGEGFRLDLSGGPLVTALAPAVERRLRARCRVDAALIVYPPDGVDLPMPSDAIRLETIDAAIGTSELVLLPIPAGRLHAADLPAALAAAVRHTDARVVALAGMLPALTGLGLRPLWEGGPQLTTGHGATVVAMLLTLEEVLARTGRSWPTLTVGFCGYGAIGRAVRDLVVHVLGPPARELRSDPRLAGADDDLLGADLILAATSGGVALDVAALRPGTIVIDDSFPRAFDDAAARARMEQHNDVLLVGGGQLDAGVLDRRSPFAAAAALRARYGARWLPGCHAEALLVASDARLGPTVGPVDVARALAVLAAVRAAGLRAAPLHLGAWELPEAVVAGVRG